jgi:hypothetical protein
MTNKRFKYYLIVCLVIYAALSVGIVHDMLRMIKPLAPMP